MGQGLRESPWGRLGQPLGFPNVVQHAFQWGGVNGGATSGQWGRLGVLIFHVFFGAPVLKPKRERRPKEEIGKTERPIWCSRVGLSTVAY